MPGNWKFFVCLPNFDTVVGVALDVTSLVVYNHLRLPCYDVWIIFKSTQLGRDLAGRGYTVICISNKETSINWCV